MTTKPINEGWHSFSAWVCTRCDNLAFEIDYHEPQLKCQGCGHEMPQVMRFMARKLQTNLGMK